LKKTTVYFILLILPFAGMSQIGGSKVFSFVTIPVSPRAASLGGSAMAINDDDISLAAQNPALYTVKTDGKLTFDYINYVADISLGDVSYSHYIEHVGMVAGGIEYLNGGKNVLADENGYQYGNFNSSEYAFHLSYARSFDSSLTIGATIKPVVSHIESYTSTGLLADIGISYTTSDKLLTTSILARNFGAQLTAYDSQLGSVPFEVQLGVSKKLAYAPFRFSMVLQQLQKPKLKEDQTNFSDVGIDKQENKTTEEFIDYALRHLILGVEFLPTKNFFLRAGLDYNRRQNLKLSDKPGSAGFSWGFGFKISKFRFAYANSRYHISGPSHQFSITTNLNDFLR
jgi:hypothetical protein